jgi:hypothetical protein
MGGASRRQGIPRAGRLQGVGLGRQTTQEAGHRADRVGCWEAFRARWKGLRRVALGTNTRSESLARSAARGNRIRRLLSAVREAAEARYRRLSARSRDRAPVAGIRQRGRAVDISLLMRSSSYELLRRMGRWRPRRSGTGGACGYLRSSSDRPKCCACVSSWPVLSERSISARGSDDLDGGQSTEAPDQLQSTNRRGSSYWPRSVDPWSGQTSSLLGWIER